MARNIDIASPTAKAERDGAPEVICEMTGVRGGEFSVHLVKDADSGRLAVRGINEGGFSCVDIDLMDVLSWLHRTVPEGVDLDAIARALAILATRHGSE